MKLNFNEAVRVALNIFPENALLPKPIERTYYPMNALVVQDARPIVYMVLLNDLMFDPGTVDLDERNKMLDWQIQQVYRIVNAAIASANEKMMPFKKQLLGIKAKLEECEEIQRLLMRSGSLDIACSGHGAWNVEDGFITLPEQHPGIFTYIGFGAAMSPTLGTSIENLVFQKDNIIIEDDMTGDLFRLPEDVSYTNMFTKTQKVPNFIFGISFVPGQRSRVIEVATGKTLWEIRNNIFLNEIVKVFSTRPIHWACCMETNTNDKHYAPFKGYTFQKETDPLFLSKLSFFKFDNTEEEKVEFFESEIDKYIQDENCDESNNVKRNTTHLKC